MAKHNDISSFDSIVEAIRKAGLYAVEVQSKRKWNKKKGLGYVYLGVGATERRLILAADEMKYLLPCNPVEVRRMAETGRPGIWSPMYNHTVRHPNPEGDNDNDSDDSDNDLHGHAWEKALIPKDIENPDFIAGQEAFYDSMQTEDLSLRSLLRSGCAGMSTHPQRPYEGLYLPFETHSIMQKPVTNAARVKQTVHLICPPTRLQKMKAAHSPKLEFYYDLYARDPTTKSIFRSIDRQRLVLDILNAHPQMTSTGIAGGCGLDISKLKKSRI